MVTVKDLKYIASTAEGPLMQACCDAFNKYAPQYGITDSRDISQVLGNFCHETGGFRSLSESLNYSPDGLIKTFGRRISSADAARYGRTGAHSADQRSIANIVYGGEWGRKNLGNTEPEDGWNFRGSGWGQATGRANYERAEKETGIPFTADPALMRDVDKSMQACLMLWQKWGLSELAKAGQTTAIRERWNGGSLGLKEVTGYVARGLKLNLKIDPIAGAPEEPAKLPQSDTKAVPASPAAPIPQPATAATPAVKTGSAAASHGAAVAIGAAATAVAAKAGIWATFSAWMAAHVCSCGVF